MLECVHSAHACRCVSNRSIFSALWAVHRWRPCRKMSWADSLSGSKQLKWACSTLMLYLLSAFKLEFCSSSIFEAVYHVKHSALCLPLQCLMQGEKTCGMNLKANKLHRCPLWLPKCCRALVLKLGDAPDLKRRGQTAYSRWITTKAI